MNENMIANRLLKAAMVAQKLRLINNEVCCISVWGLGWTDRVKSFAGLCLATANTGTA